MAVCKLILANTHSVVPLDLCDSCIAVLRPRAAPGAPHHTRRQQVQYAVKREGMLLAKGTLAGHVARFDV